MMEKLLFNEQSSFLESFDIFKEVPMNKKLYLKEQLKERHYKKGDGIYYLNTEYIKHVYFLRKGSVKLSRFVDTGDEQVLDILGPGELFGRYDFNDENDEVAVAIEDSLVYSLDLTSWYNFIFDNAAFSTSVLKLVGLKLKHLEAKVDQIQHLNTTGKIKAVIKYLSDKYSQGGKGNSREFNLNLTHRDIAHLAGTSRQSATLTLNELQRKRIISYGRRKMIVEDYRSLS